MAPLPVKNPDVLRRVAQVGHYYGFQSLEGSSGRSLPGEVGLAVPEDPFARNALTSLRTYLKKPPTRGDETRLFSRFSVVEKPTHHVGQFGLYVMGTKNGFAEALLMRAALSMLEEAGLKDVSLRINSIGCRDSSAKYGRDLSQALRRLSDALPPALGEHIEGDPYRVLMRLLATRHEILEELPRPIDYLTSPARLHFREIIEYLEHNNLPYELDEWLVGHRDFYSHTIFAIGDKGAGEGASLDAFARGARCDEGAKRLAKTTLPAVGIVVHIPFAGPSQAVVVHKERSPLVCFIRLGYDAQVKSFQVTEALRRAKAPFVQCFKGEKLSEQLAFAEDCGAPYTLIMGQREAMEGSVIVRNVATRSQQCVPLSQLATFAAALRA